MLVERIDEENKMGERISLSASDGHQLSAYRAEPDGAPKAGVVILQEIFGITNHIRSVTDQYASLGYVAVAPALFDRVGADITLDYTDIQRALEVVGQLDLDDAMADIQAAADNARSAGKVAAIGYCWGGALVDLAACRLNIDAGVSYYGRRTSEWLDEKPKCPVIYHFGRRDQSIPMDMVEKITAARPNGIVHIYDDAGHGFNCNDRADYSPDDAKLALSRSLEFLDAHL